MKVGCGGGKVGGGEVGAFHKNRLNCPCILCSERLQNDMYVPYHLHPGILSAWLFIDSN